MLLGMLCLGLSWGKHMSMLRFLVVWEMPRSGKLEKMTEVERIELSIQ